MAAFSPATLTERPASRKVVLIGPDGGRTYFASVSDAAHSLQASKTSVRKACRTRSRVEAGWLKYRDCKDPAGSPPPPGDDLPYRSQPAPSLDEPTPAQVAAQVVRVTQMLSGGDGFEPVWTVTACPTPGNEEEVPPLTGMPCLLFNQHQRV